MNAFWKFGSVVSFNKVKDHPHDACPINHQDRKIDDMES